MTYQKNSSRFFIISTFVISFALCLVLADFFSNLITIKAFNGITSTSKISGFSVYSIALGKYSNKTNATESAKNLQKQSGAGFVWENDEFFYVLSSAYLEENDCKLVKSNLEKNGLEPEIFLIEIPSITINTNYNPNELNEITSALNAYKTAYENLYDISIALDTSIKTESESRILLSDVLNLVNKTKLSFDTVFNSQPNSDALNIKLSLYELSQIINNLCEFKETSNQTFSSKIKYCYIECLKLNKDLISSLST